MFGFGESDTSHPAELGFIGRMWEGFKHVAGKTLKYGMWGAVAGAAIGAVVSLPMLVPLLAASPLVAIGTAATAFFSGAGVMGALGAGVAGALGTIGLPILAGAAIVGGVAALAGAFFGLRGAGDAADEVSAERVANADRAQMRNERAHMMELKMQQQRLAMAQQAQEMGLANPNMGLPGHGHGHGLNV